MPLDRQRALARYRTANDYVNQGLIRRDPPNLSASPRREHRDVGQRTRREWMEWFVQRIGEPQRDLAAIHVGGTSGKGSVCVMIAEILRAAGVRTGLHVTPYIQVATEKLWLDGRYASAEQYALLVDRLRPLAEPCRGPDVPMHGMFSVALCLEHFKREGAELSVIEVGVGGRSDLTNVLETRVAVITNVGLDHTKTLGGTLEQIAWHKAGIIKRGARAVVYAEHPDAPALVAARHQCEQVAAPLRIVRPESWERATDADGRSRVSLRGERITVRQIELAMPGAFQAANAAVALAACEALDDPRIDADAVRVGLSRARLPGRLERLTPSSAPCPVVLDGAHNPAKLRALTDALGSDGTRLHLVYGALEVKDHGDALGALVRRARSVTLTEPRVYAKRARASEQLAQQLRPAADQPISVVPAPRDAVAHALDQATSGDLVVVTGSLYLLGNVRGLWHDDDCVLLERTSWPGRL